MGVSQRNLEELLRQNVNELAQDLARECGLACKKAGIYGPDHPAALSAADKPFQIMRRFFEFRRVLPFHLMRGKLSIAQIQLKETHLTDQFVQYLQMLDMFGLLFDEKLSVRDLSVFLNALTRREHRFASRFDFGAALKQQGVTTIEVNTERCMRFFEERKQFRGEIAGNYSVAHLLREQLPDEPLSLASLWQADDTGLESAGVDYRSSLVSHLLPEKIAGIPKGAFVAVLHDPAVESRLHTTLQVMASFHPARTELLGANLPQSSEQQKPLDQIGRIRLQAKEQLEQSLHGATRVTATAADLAAVGAAFERVMKTGQSEFAEKTLLNLLQELHGGEIAARRQRVQLIQSLLARPQLSAGLFAPVPAFLVDLLKDRRESFEHGEVATLVVARFLGEQNYAALVPLAAALGQRVERRDGVTTIDSPVVKRIRDAFHETDQLQRLVHVALRGSNNVSREQQQSALQLLAAICSEEVAAVLAAHIADADRGVRQSVLRTLGEMGSVAESVCVTLLHDVRGESPENPERWYKIRNAFHVLGQLKAAGTLTTLRTFVDDLDPRVRRELVLCLEAIRTDQSGDLLLECATDPDKGVRAAAAAALGAAGDRQTADAIILMLRDGKEIDAVKLIAALGRLGGENAKQFLFELLSADSSLEPLLPHASKDELRAAVIRALGTIADPDAISQIRRFSDDIPFAQRLLLRSSLVGEALNEILQKR